MLTYLARPRGVYTEPLGMPLEFPCELEIEFKFEPRAAFGDDGPIGRMVPKDSKVLLEWNACKSEATIKTDGRIAPVELDIKVEKTLICFKGASMRVTTTCDTRAELQGILETCYYGLPAVLAVDFLDAPVVSEVRGNAGGTPFCWGLLRSGGVRFDVVTTKIQEQRLRTAVERLGLLQSRWEAGGHRLLAATEYYHIACLLNRSGNRYGEFLAESLLNLAKALEVLFPAPPQQTIGSVRTALADLGFQEVEIEALFIPAIALRNAIDVAHPSLATFSEDDVATLHRYADAAEDGFGHLMRRLFDLFVEGSLTLAPVQSHSPSREARRVIRRLAENLQRYQAHQT